MPEYNGHLSKGHWNVALYMANEYPIYRFAMGCIQGGKAKNPANWLQIATYRFMAGYEGERTPDGFKYTKPRVRAALQDLAE